MHVVRIWRFQKIVCPWISASDKEERKPTEAKDKKMTVKRCRISRRRSLERYHHYWWSIPFINAVVLLRGDADTLRALIYRVYLWDVPKHQYSPRKAVEERETSANCGTMRSTTDCCEKKRRRSYEERDRGMMLRHIAAVRMKQQDNTLLARMRLMTSNNKLK